MVSFKFRTSKTVNFATDVPSKHGFHLNDLNRICVYLHYYDNEINPFYVSQGSIRRAFSFSRRNKLWKVILQLRYSQAYNESYKITDSSQLPPVNEKTSQAFLIASNTYYLKEVVRQGDNNPISKLLKLLREDIDNKNGWRFLDYISKNRQDYNEEIKGFYVCGQTEFSDLIDTCFNDEEYTKNIDLYRIIAYTNSRVAQWNNHVRHMIIQDADKSLITRNDLIMSYTTVVNVFNDIIINNSEEYIVKDIVDTVDNDYEFKGFLIKFQAIHGGAITQPLFVIDHYDNYTFQMYYKKLTSLIDDAKKASSSERGSKWKQYFDFKRKYLIASNITNSNGKILFSRDLDYGFAITSHRAQGSTYKNVFVDINDMIYDKYGHPYTNRDEMLRRLYVACSRASNQLVLSYGK